MSGPGLGIERGVNVGHSAEEFAARQRVDAGDRFLPEPDERHVLLVDLRLEPNEGQIGEPVKVHSRLEHHPFHSRLLDHDPVGRRKHRDRPRGLRGRLQFLQLRGRHAKQAQALERRLRKRCVSAPRQRGEFQLRVIDIRGIGLEKRLAFFDRLSGGIDEELLDPAFELSGDIGERGFVEVHDADRPDRPHERPPGHLPDPHAHRLDGGGIDGDRRAVSFCLVPARGRLRGLLAHRLELHLADRAVAGVVLDDLRMHPAGVELLFGRRLWRRA
jgi:hypothetical protein